MEKIEKDLPKWSMIGWWSMLYPRAFNCNLGHNVGRHGQWLELWLKHLIYWWNNMSLIKFEGFDFYWMFCKLPWTLMWNLWFRIEDFI